MCRAIPTKRRFCSGRRLRPGDQNVYVRLSVQTNSAPLPVTGEGFLTVREGRGGVVLAVGPMLENVTAAVEGLDVTVLYATTVRPFDGPALRAALGTAGILGPADVVLVEPYLAGTSTSAANEALTDIPHRILALGTARSELRRYGTIEEHLTGQGLDPAALRQRISSFLPAGR